MQFKQVISALITTTMLFGMIVSSTAYAGSKEKGKTYDEIAFLKAFSGKSRKVVSDALGQPLKKEQSVKPTNAESFVARAGATKDDTSKAVNVEMWYYANNVKYDATHTYKSTELTFVNDRCENVAFFNNK